MSALTQFSIPGNAWYPAIQPLGGKDAGALEIMPDQDDTADRDREKRLAEQRRRDDEILASLGLLNNVVNTDQRLPIVRTMQEVLQRRLAEHAGRHLT